MSIRPQFWPVLILGLAAIVGVALAPRLAAAPKAGVKALPPIEGIAAWLNTPDDEPLTTEDLEGKVVLIHFWTFGCYNCVNTVPHVNDWYEEFHGEDFVLIGIHTPEFDMEKRQERVAAFLEEHDIAYPVAMDNDFATWKNFNNRYWPADYLFDHTGRLLYHHIGEGDYEAMAERIRDAKAEIVEK